MRKFNELSKAEKEEAINYMLTNLLKAITEGIEVFDKEIQSRIEKAFRKAEQMQTPWFAHEYIMEDPITKKYLQSIAEDEAQKALYRLPTDPEVITLFGKGKHLK
jgi:hypothetical protein